MTTLTRPVNRKLDVAVPAWSGRERGRLMVARISREGIYLRPEGCRQSGALLLPWASAWGAALRIKTRDLALRKAQRSA